MPAITPNAVVAASGSGGPSFLFDTIGTDQVPLTKVVFGVDGAVVASWDFNTGALSDGTPRVTLATNDPGVVALEAIESYLDTEVAALLTGVQLIDDCVETNRFAVNLVVGQIGITAGAGAVAANTPRVTLASDDPAVATLTTIDADTGALAANTLDYDTGVGTDTQVIMGIALPASGGAVAGGTATDPLRVDPTGTTAQPASQSGTWNITNVSGTVSLPTGAATDAKLDTIIGHIDTEIASLVTAIEILDNIVSGAEAQVDVITSALPTGASTLAEQQTQTTALQLIDNTIIAHDAAASGASVNMAGLEGRNTEPTAVGTTGDATRALATMLGKQITVPYALPASTWQYASVAGGVVDTADDVAKAAAGVGSRNYITHCSVVNGHATVSTEVVIKSAATIIWRGWAQAAGGGVAERFDPPLRGGDNEAINVTNITTGSATYFNLQGYVAAE